MGMWSNVRRWMERLYRKSGLSLSWRKRYGEVGSVHRGRSHPRCCHRYCWYWTPLQAQQCRCMSPLNKVISYDQNAHNQQVHFCCPVQDWVPADKHYLGDNVRWVKYSTFVKYYLLFASCWGMSGEYGTEIYWCVNEVSLRQSVSNSDSCWALLYLLSNTFSILTCDQTDGRTVHHERWYRFSCWKPSRLLST